MTKWGKRCEDASHSNSDFASRKHVVRNPWKRLPRFAQAFGVRARPRAALGPLTVFSAQKSSGTFTASVLNEYTDFTNPDRALLSNQPAEHQGY
jgi:hypothetical protein